MGPILPQKNYALSLSSNPLMFSQLLKQLQRKTHLQIQNVLTWLPGVCMETDAQVMFVYFTFTCVCEIHYNVTVIP